MTAYEEVPHPALRQGDVVLAPSAISAVLLPQRAIRIA
jgi:hypothetical protein